MMTPEVSRQEGSQKEESGARPTLLKDYRTSVEKSVSPMSSFIRERLSVTPTIFGSLPKIRVDKNDYGIKGPDRTVVYNPIDYTHTETQKHRNTETHFDLSSRGRTKASAVAYIILQ